jgi:hypothetical protein
MCVGVDGGLERGGEVLARGVSPGLSQRGLPQEQQDDEPEDRERYGGEERGLQRLGEPAGDREMDGLG